MRIERVIKFKDCADTYEQNGKRVYVHQIQFENVLNEKKEIANCEWHTTEEKSGLNLNSFAKFILKDIDGSAIKKVRVIKSNQRMVEEREIRIMMQSSTNYASQFLQGKKASEEDLFELAEKIFFLVTTK